MKSAMRLRDLTRLPRPSVIRGNAVLVSLIIMTSAITVSLGLASLIGGEIRGAAQAGTSERGYYKAESFTEQALWEKKQNAAYAVDYDGNRGDNPAAVGAYVCAGTQTTSCFETSPNTTATSLNRLQVSAAATSTVKAIAQDGNSRLASRRAIETTTCGAGTICFSDPIQPPGAPGPPPPLNRTVTITVREVAACADAGSQTGRSITYTLTGYSGQTNSSGTAVFANVPDGITPTAGYSGLPAGWTACAPSSRPIGSTGAQNITFKIQQPAALPAGVPIYEHEYQGDEYFCYRVNPVTQSGGSFGASFNSECWGQAVGLSPVVWKAWTSPIAGSSPMTEYGYSGNGDYCYTLDDAAAVTGAHPCSAYRSSNRSTRVVWYGFKNPVPGTVPIYQYYNAANGDHCYSRDNPAIVNASGGTHSCWNSRPGSGGNPAAFIMGYVAP